MPDNPIIDELLDRWEENAERGILIPVEELCKDYPELIKTVREQIEALRAMDRLLEDRNDQSSGSAVNEITAQSLAAEIALTNPQIHARGGLGIVYTAEDSQLHRSVAVKFLNPDFANQQTSRDRFCLEAEITSRLDHPGIVPVHGIGETSEGLPFYVMRYIDGQTLEKAILNFHEQQANWNDHKRNLEFRILLTRFVSVCNTIAYAHNRGIIHRDIKPENIILGKYSETLVVDWGLAMPIERDDRARESGEHTLLPLARKAGHDQSSEHGAGTPIYMSPEQAGGSETITAATDIYSLGAVLYKILTGQNPVDGRNLSLPEIQKRIQQGQLPSPGEINPQISRPLEAICLKAMSLNPASRYPTALAIAKDIESYLADERVPAYKESPLETPLRWFRQHRQMARVTLVSISLLMLVLIGSSTWLAALARKTNIANAELLQSAAKLTALTVAMEINDRWRILEMESADPALISLLRQANSSPEETDWNELLNWLRRAKLEHENTAKAESWFICDATGRQVTRIPESSSIGKNYAHRDYFHGNGFDLESGQTGDPTHIDSVHLSVPYQSTSDQDLKVAFTIPIWSTRIGLPGREFLGVLGMSIKLGHFEILQQNLGPDQIAVLADIETDELSGIANGGLILHHPRYSDTIHDEMKNAEVELPRLSPELIEQLQNFRTTRVREHQSNSTRNFTNGFLLNNYPDPTEIFNANSSRRWQAAFEPVIVDGRESESQNTGWVVIVQKRMD